MYTKEQKVLRFSMMLLFLALMIVYIIWYQVKGNELKQIMQLQISGTDIQITPKSGNLIPTVNPVVDTNSGILGSIPDITGDKLPNTTGTTASVTKPTTGTINKSTNIRLLSGTSIYYGS
ncbi:MAG TPA: hypothetical protein PKC87_05270, partial [Candidatus Absconditabacterales bacterium]|nr:hypothetical protein [Candidatus Absconditabacterales bacterium]